MYFCAEIKQTQFCYNFHVLYIDILKELYVYIYIYIYIYIWHGLDDPTCVRSFGVAI